MQEVRYHWPPVPWRFFGRPGRGLEYAYMDTRDTHKRPSKSPELLWAEGEIAAGAISPLCGAPQKHSTWLCELSVCPSTPALRCREHHANGRSSSPG